LGQKIINGPIGESVVDVVGNVVKEKNGCLDRSHFRVGRSGDERIDGDLYGL
jgi:hypothetical protein